ncbi:formylmethanofuran dehydrogenase subunit B, partial [Candidatus Bathyarchaeota archaeon]
NMVGAVETTLKATGFPYAVDFSTNPPNHNPQKTSIIPVLIDEKVDSALIVGSDPLAHLPVETAKKLLKIPFIVLDFVESLTMSKATVRIPVTVTGVETGGTAYRMDGKEVKLSPILKPPEGLKSDEQVLSVLLSKL